MLQSIQNVEGFAGPSGVGAITLLGAFVLIDGVWSGAFAEVDHYAKTSIAVTIALPLLALTYVIGIVIISFSETLVIRLYGPTTDEEAGDIIMIDGVQKDDSLIVNQYVRTRQEKSLLAGNAFALLLLSLGLGSQAFSDNLPTLKIALGFCCIVTLLLAGVVFHMSGTKSKAAHKFAKKYTSSRQR